MCSDGISTRAVAPLFPASILAAYMWRRLARHRSSFERTLFRKTISVDSAPSLAIYICSVKSHTRQQCAFQQALCAFSHSTQLLYLRPIVLSYNDYYLMELKGLQILEKIQQAVMIFAAFAIRMVFVCYKLT